MIQRLIFSAVVVSLFASMATANPLVRIKDITDVQGVGINALYGMGLVSGLDGLGGKNPDTRRMYANFTERLGLRMDPLTRAALRNDTQLKTTNLSVVAVTAEIPDTALAPSTFDVYVSVLDDATSLRGGILLPTPLLGEDTKVYAMANGRVSLGGFSLGGAAASVQKNHNTTARVVNGGKLKVAPGYVKQHEQIRLMLRSPDYETAIRIADAINLRYVDTAKPVRNTHVDVQIPPDFLSSTSRFIGRLQNLMVEPDSTAKIVINERTGTVVIGNDVKISNVAITHGNLTVTTVESPQVSQPLPRSRGETVVVPRTDIEVVEETNPVSVIQNATTVGEIAKALNALGVSPQDISSIFQMLKESGDLHAKLEFR